MNDPLAALSSDTDGRQLDALRVRLAARAADAELLDVAYRTVDSPVGPLLLAATPVGLVRVAYAREDFDAVLATLARRISPRVLRAASRLDPAARELAEYFDHRRTSFDVPLDLRLSTGFRRRVLDELPRVGYGRTVSYGRLAVEIGNARAVRAVGTACATNPLPVIVPCHRVVRSDGTSGEYIGGVAAKRTLLELEQYGEQRQKQ